MNKPYISLQPSEIAVLRAAAQIFSAYITSGQCTTDTEEEYLQKAIKQAIQIAQMTDENIQADKEVM